MTLIQAPEDFRWKLWIYTNYDCNLQCRYCVAKSSPRAPRLALDLASVQRIVDEAVDLGFREVFFTGGEPFILPEIYDMLAYAAERVSTTVLTNAMLLRGKRLQRLLDLPRENLRVQVSLDGGRAEHHDAYRGPGTWARTVEGIRLLLEHGFHVRLSTTETPANADHIDELIAFRGSLGVADEDHFIRPLARRGFSDEGVEVSAATLAPEMTVSKTGVYWHPLASPDDCDLRVSTEIFPLANALNIIFDQVHRLTREGAAALTAFN